MAESSVETNATPTTTPQARRLKGHKDIATCCIASRDRPGLIASSSEDGCVCWFDMRCKDLLYTMDVAQNPISSLCFKPGNEDIIYVSSENEVKVLDVHMLASWKPLESFNYNKEEINQITCNSKSSFLAAADDGGDIKIIDIRQKCLYKTLRAAHESICSSVQFLPWRPWEVITGGLDSKLIMWDFSKGRPFKVMDLGKSDPESSSSSGAQCFNPAFVHAIAVPEVDMLEKLDKICVVARGDGVVDVINIESEFTAAKSKGNKGGQSKSNSKSKSNRNVSSINSEEQDQNQRTRLRLDYSCGGHTAAVSCVAFSMFGEKGRYVISGGNDKAVKAWNLSRFTEPDQTIETNDFLHLNIILTRKVNWLCTTPTDTDNLVVCDTSKVVKDGCVFWFDMRCKDLLFTMDVAQNPISSLCFKPGNDDIIYVSSENEVKVLDVHMLSSWKPLESFNYNKEEINQITCNSKSSFLAAADDGSDIKIIDIRQKCLCKTLRAAHESICSSVQFLPWRPWEVIVDLIQSL